MKKLNHYLLTFAAFCSVTAATAQMTPRSIITSAPPETFLTVNTGIILDLLDYAEAGQTRTLDNIFNEKASITELTPTTVTLVTGLVHNLTFAMLSPEKSGVIMLIDRVLTPETDATISFYNSRWQPLDKNKILKMPGLTDWTGKMPDDELRRLENALPFLMVDANYDPDNQVLTFTPQLGDYISVENKEFVTAAIAPRLDYKWNGKSFKPLKR